MLDWRNKVTAADRKQEKERCARERRNAAISETDWLVSRHRDEQESGIATTLTDSSYKALLAHRQILRELTKKDGWADMEITEFNPDEYRTPL